MASVQLSALRKRFGSTEVLQGVDLDIREGEFMVFVGPSGCGKSTLLRIIAGLEQPSEGDVAIGGQSVVNVRPSDRGVAMVFQSYALYPHMTVAENMGFALRVAGVSAADRETRVREVAASLDLGPLLQRYPRELSGGQRQRVAMGRALVRQPAVFLFDEPLSNLDAELRTRMRIELARLHEQLGTTMIYVTHDQVEAMTLGDRIAVFNRGRIEQVGPPMQLYEQPANLFVAGFLGSPRINLCTKPANDCGPAALRWWERLGREALAGATTLGLRPEHVELTVLTQAEPGADAVPARVVLTEHLGDASVLHLRVEGLPELIQVKAGDRWRSAMPGDTVGVSPRAGQVLAFDAGGGRIGGGV
jgi:multiple sugar transport system ATP-binding protein